MNPHAALFARQRTYFQTVVKKRGYHERLTGLKSLQKWIQAHSEAICEAVYADFRKPLAETELSEVRTVSNEIDYATRHLRRWMRPQPVSGDLSLIGTEARVQVEPKGVVEIIAPWNYPFMLAVNPLVSALAAGNCVILKPSEMAPHTAELLARMAEELFPEEEVAVVKGGVEVAQALGELPFDHIFFTGSPAVGKLVMKAAAAHLTPVTLELGGQNPAIVHPSADLKDTAEKLIWGKFFNGGQSCMAVNSLFVPRSLHASLREALVQALAQMYGADENARQASPDLARLIHERHFEHVSRLVDESLAAGARLLLGNRRDKANRYFSPTLLDEVPWEAPGLQEEIFGPVLPIVPYEEEAEVWRFLQTQGAPLALSLFAQDEPWTRLASQQLASGTVCINDTTLPFAYPGLPFGGIGQSGMGQAHGQAGFLAFSHQRAYVTQRVGLTSTKLVYPPYKKAVQQTISLLRKWL
jgi:aldehyde dehydrogenase (NAD+)